MIICQCNVVTQDEVEEIIRSFLDEDCWQLIVPGRVFNAAQKKGRCCGCFPNIVEAIIEVTERYHLEHEGDDEKVVYFLNRVRGLRDKFRSKEYHERRSKSH